MLLTNIDAFVKSHKYPLSLDEGGGIRLFYQTINIIPWIKNLSVQFNDPPVHLRVPEQYNYKESDKK
jgi:hypothetical protein